MRDLFESHGFVVHRYQTIAALALLIVLVGTTLITNLLARNRGLEEFFAGKSSEFADKNRTIFSDTGNFIDFEDRVLLNEIPQRDHSQGGIYFFGSSNMKWAFTTWDLPAEQKRVIGNYGIGASSHTDQLRLIQLLMEQRGFLAAGKRDLVIFGVTFQVGRKDSSDGYFASLFRRHGLYTVTADQRITPVPMSALERWLAIEKARSGGFLWNVGRVLKAWATTVAGYRRPPPRGIASHDLYLGFMGGEEWPQNMDAELDRFKETILFLRSHQVQVKVMFLPEATWDDGLPYRSRYEAKIRALCAATATPLIDLSHAMADEDFADSSHLTVDGQKKFRNLIMREISEHLQKLKSP